MILQNDFYAIASSTLEEGTATFAVHINPLHPIFDGHFPGNPVTPGVAQLEMVKELISTVLDKPLRLTEMGTCKFLAILNPNATPDVEVKLAYSTTESDEIKVTASISTAETSFFKMNGVYS